MESETMRIGFLTSLDARNQGFWSGTPYYMSQALQAHVGDVTYMRPQFSKLLKPMSLYSKAQKLISGKNLRHSTSVILSKLYAWELNYRIMHSDFDVIFCPAGSAILGFLNTKLPIVYSSDATFESMTDYYPSFSNLAKRSLMDGNLLESRAISKAQVSIYPSSWAADSALKDYNANPNRVLVLNYGANLKSVPRRDEVLARPRKDRCNLLFVGVDWWRKGGDKAFEALLSLKARGVSASLTVCGCVPPSEVQDEDLQVYPFLDKKNPDHLKILDALYRESDFFVLPARSEAYGIVFCEAAAYGLPVLAARTGGIPSIVRDGVNGILLADKAKGVDYADVLELLFRDAQRYEGLSRGARDEFESRLNWDAWGRAVAATLRDFDFER